MVSIEVMNLKYSKELVSILNVDKILKNILGFKENNINYQDFSLTNEKWMKSNNAILFAILFNNKAVGMISLSNQNMIEKTARIGYWIGSKYWNKGISKTAFELVLKFALTKKIELVLATINKNNIYSLKIWKKYPVEIIDKNSDRFLVKLNLKMF